MDINQPPAKPRDRGGWDALQVAREHDQARVARRPHQLGRVRRIGQQLHGHTCAARPLERRRVAAVRHDARDARHRGVLQGVEQRLDVGAAARHQHRHRNGRHRVQGASAAGLGPAVTVSVNAPVACRSLLVATMR